MGAWDEAEGWMSGLLSEIYGVMKPLVNPLVEKWDSVVGQPEAVNDVAAQWRGMSESLSNLASYQRQAVAALDGGWQGEAQEAYLAKVQEVAEAISSMAGQVKGVAGFLDSAATEVRNVEQLVKELIFELIEWAAISLAVGAAGAIFTFGASAAAGAAAAAAKAGVTGAKIATLLTKVATALKNIAAMIKSYQAWVKALGFKKAFAFKATVQTPLVKAVTGLDAKWRDPLFDLGEIHFDKNMPAPIDGGRV
ncbi:WXG100 family type VII secretion target [Nocardioides houyundeii]|uniref:WXG100 family type VII secretion target n=1 Tax=Nocardioides houyundeii TaxID=2045452 RepID=UPI000DF2FE2A|nr:WXG100 family type VII secretion target [Nocardioides houyundeii]